MSRVELQREKLLNAIIFFAKNTRHCHKLKLLKLLFLLDFEMFRKTGKATTGLSYFAWPKGPVARELFEELDAPREDMRAVVLITSASKVNSDFGNDAMVFKPLRAFDEGCFTPRELKEMTRLAEIYKDAYAQTMTDLTHKRGTPWQQVYEVEKRPQALIPYALALDGKPDSITKEQAEEIEHDDRVSAALFK